MAILAAVGKGLSYSAVTMRVYLYLYPVHTVQYCSIVMSSYCIGYVRKLITLHKLNDSEQ